MGLHAVECSSVRCDNERAQLIVQDGECARKGGPGSNPGSCVWPLLGGLFSWRVVERSVGLLARKAPDARSYCHERPPMRENGLFESQIAQRRSFVPNRASGAVRASVRWIRCRTAAPVPLHLGVSHGRAVGSCGKNEVQPSL